MAFNFPSIDRVILHLGNTPFKVTWYSLSYVVGIILGFIYIKFLNKKSENIYKIDTKAFDELMTYLIIGIVLGGRLGYVLFYELEYNLAHPLNIIKTWEGGMSFHGGLFGVIVASYIFCTIYKIRYFLLMDLLACAAPIGLFFGRIANFINAELYGRYTESDFGVIFPGDHLPRHPSQLYEAASEGLLLFIILFYLFRYSAMKKYHGALSGLFLVFYSTFRILIENYRQPDEQLGFIFMNFTMGQILCLPMFIVGLILVAYAYRVKNEAA